MNDPAPFRKPRIMPPVWLLLAAGAMWVLDRWLPLAPLPGEGIHGWLAWLFLAPGVALLGWAAFQFIRARTGLVPFSESTTLVTGGLYRFTRNPMYLGMVALLIGGAVKAGSVSALLPIPVFVWIIRNRFILNEERFLETLYGDAFRAYCRRVRRWL